MVSDMDKAVKFYVETLGLKVKARYGKHFAQVQAPGLVIALHPAIKQGPPPGTDGSISIGFLVDNLDGSMHELEAKGARFSNGTIDDGQVRLAFFTDSDGNHLYLSQSKWG